jgi:putative transposase
LVQHRNNRDACFFCEDEYRYFLASFKRSRSIRRGIACLRADDQSRASADNAARHRRYFAAHAAPRRHYVLCINRHYRRTGTLWEGRHKARLVQADQYLLACMRYIEVNPVAAGMLQSLEQYRWSSYRRHAWGEPNPLLRDHDLYVRLGANSFEFRSRRSTFITSGNVLPIITRWAMTDSGSRSKPRCVSDSASAGARPSMSMHQDKSLRRL